MEPLLRLEQVTVCYHGLPVVRDISFCLGEGEILGIVGESGSGKSTVLKAIMGLLGEAGRVTRGDIYYRGQNVADLPEKELRKLRGPEMGMVFQDCKSSLCPIRTVGEQICECVEEHGLLAGRAEENGNRGLLADSGGKKGRFLRRGRTYRREICARAAGMMEKIGLADPERVLASYPFELSGGMNQRVGICMAMLLHPALLLLDEPTSALDVTVQKQVVEELELLRKEYGTAMVLVTHNIGVAGRLADQVLVLKEGRGVEYGPADQVLHRPENGYTKELMDSVFHLKRP